MYRSILALTILFLITAYAQAGAQNNAAHLPLVIGPTLPPFAQTAAPMPTATVTRSMCDPSYPNVCIPPPPPDLDCNRIIYRNFIVLPPDPHDFDADNDGIGCEDNEAATATHAPADSPTPTATSTATPTGTSQNNVTVVYRLEGNVSRVNISYIDASGTDKELEAPLPWTLQFVTNAEADLAVEAYSTNDEELYLKCSIEINGSVVNFDETQNAIDGVVCNRFMP